MKGIIFNLLEEVVSDEHGADAWDDLLDAAGVEGAYTALGNYADAEFVGLLRAMPASAGQDMDGTLRWFGRSAMPLLARRYGVFFEEPDSTASFLHTLNNIIHSEVRKLYPGADVPVFDFDPLPGVTPTRDTVVIGYSSRRKLCALAEGFIEGAAHEYGERVSIEQPRCMHRGDEKCVLLCRFTPAPE